jgi:glycosidase
MHKSEQFFKGHAPFHEFVHETKRLQELPAGCSKLMFTSNHDENSWNGTEYEKYGEGAKALAVLSCTWPVMPLIYSGQELPNTKRLKFFDKDEIEWNGDPALSSFYKTLLQCRKRLPAVRYGNVAIMATGEQDKIIAFTRQHEKQVIVVILNLSSSEKAKITLHHPDLRGVFTSLFSGLQYEFTQTMEFEPGPWGHLVYFNHP